MQVRAADVDQTLQPESKYLTATTHVNYTSRCRCHGNVGRQPSNYTRRAFKCPTRTTAAELSSHGRTALGRGSPDAQHPFHVSSSRQLGRCCRSPRIYDVRTCPPWFDLTPECNSRLRLLCKYFTGAKITTPSLKSLHTKAYTRV